jgi:peptidoglycan/LPS O-acetylase OafA/YrhL
MTIWHWVGAILVGWLLAWLLWDIVVRPRQRQRWLREIDSPFQYKDQTEFEAALRRKWPAEKRKLFRIDDDGYPLKDE